MHHVGGAISMASTKRKALQVAERETLIRTHTHFARNVALRLAARAPASVDPNDLIGAGMLGLIDAVDRFDRSRSIPFEAYAHRRIHGAVLDTLRADDHLTRRERRCSREADRAEDMVRMKLGRELTVDELQRARRGVPRALPRAQAFVQYDDADAGTSGDEENAFAQVAAAQEHARVRELVARLPERERTILSLYYVEDLNYREIGEVLGVTESRICQIVRGVHRTLRHQLRVKRFARLQA